MRTRDLIHLRRRRAGSENGQATVEFALILVPLLILVVGIIQFGIALNYWLDMQRIANQGARWAVVNQYPGCPRTGPKSPCTPTLQQYLDNQRLARGEVIQACISFPSGGSDVGDPVNVKITRNMNLRIPFVPLGVNITGSATMRLEQAASRYTAGC